MKFDRYIVVSAKFEMKKPSEIRISNRHKPSYARVYVGILLVPNAFGFYDTFIHCP